MQHADDHQAAFGASRGLGQLLKEIDIVAGAEGGGLQKLAHLVDEHQRAIARTALGFFKQLGDERLRGGLAAAVDRLALRLAQGGMELGYDAAAPANGRHDQPPLLNGESLVEVGLGVQMQGLASLRSQSLVGVQRARQRHSQRTLAPAKRPRPGEAALIGVRELPAHALDH